MGPFLTRHGRRRFRVGRGVIGLVMVGTILASVAAPATMAHHATSATTVDLYNVCLKKGGQVSVPAGSRVNLEFHWDSLHAWNNWMFLLAERSVVDIDGTSIRAAGRYWGSPYPVPGTDEGDPPFISRVLWQYHTGRSLQAGQSMTVFVDLSLRFPVYDGWEWSPRGQLIAWSCQITGTAKT